MFFKRGHRFGIKLVSYKGLGEKGCNIALKRTKNRLLPGTFRYIGLFIIAVSMGLHSTAQVTDTLRAEDTALVLVSADTITKKAAPAYRISGTVKDKKTGEAVPFTNIFFPRSDVGTPANLDGNFEMTVDSLPGDTIYVQAIGYNTFKKAIDKQDHNIQLYVTLETETNKLQEVVVKANAEDPAITLLKHIIAAKPRNNPARFDNYSYQAYNKVEVDVLNLTKDQFEHLPVPYLKNLSYIYDNIDTTSEAQPFLPFYLTETLSDYYYQESPKYKREYIKASQVKGVSNPNFNRSMTQYLGNFFLTFNPYDNYITFFYKQYVSPLNNAGPTFYKYKILDTQLAFQHRIINVSFEPLRKGENCFAGTFKVVDSIYALQYIQADVPKEANLNWLKNATFYKEYSPLGDSLWFCTKENLTSELMLSQGDLLKFPGLKARKTNIYTDIKVNDPAVAVFLNSKKLKADVVIADTAIKPRPAEFWAGSRPENLSKNEQAIYTMIDTLQADPQFKKFKNLVKILATGGVKWGWFEFGPYWNVYSSNTIEGSRFRYSMGTTPKLSKDVYINGYVAYGVRDDRFKYSINGLWLLHNQFPRTYVAASYTHDLDQSVNYYDRVTFDNIFTLAVRRPGIPMKFMFSDDTRFEFYKEYYSGFSHMVTLLRKNYSAYPPLPSVDIFNDEDGNPANNITQTEVNIKLRYAYKERFLYGNYYRTSLGSKYPIAELRYSRGMKGVFDGGYTYDKLRFNISANLRVAPFGQIYVNLFAGKYFGTLPYPLLEVHPGNETYVYNKYAFSMMNQYEFISDQYAGFNIEHSMGGGFLKYIPLIKKLKFRQFWTAKGVIGSLSDSNKALNLNKGFAFKTLENNPYMELGTGIENILKVFRVDFVWRVRPQPLATDPKRSYFGIFGSLKFDF